MNQRIAFTSVLLFSLFSSTLIFAQADQAVRGAADALQGKVAENQEPLTAGPKDDKEVKAPGAIDEDCSREFKKTDSGLKYRILRKTDGEKPTTSSKVEVHYKGWLNDKTIFDSSYRRGESISFGLTQVIKGWTEGMQLIGEGGMIELDIPYQLAYGERGTPGGPIPPKAQLHFVVELISVK
jgi:FKBP-type peptidyl-prolyl cis-trans isomerase FkpA